MAELFTISFLENFKVFIVAILIYVIIFALLKTIKPLGEDSKLNSLIALLSAIIVSFSGVVTYSITYAINWFVIIFFIIFLLMLLLMFLGVKTSDIANFSASHSKYIVIGFVILFSIIIIKSFFALNNTFDTSNPAEDNYNIDTSANFGVDDLSSDNESSFLDRLHISSEILSSVIFLIGIGIFVILIGK